jgi:undecaprenyl-diphosphatase
MRLDIQVFYLLNNLAGKSDLFDFILQFLATSFFWVLWILFFVMLIITVHDKSRLARFIQKISETRKINFKLFLTAIVSSGLGYLLSQIIGKLFFRERPFVALDSVTKLIEKSALDKSFPSDHTVLSFALAFCVFYFDKRWGKVFLILASLVGLSRVFVGVHYLSDVIGGAILAWLVSWLVYKTLRKVKF